MSLARWEPMSELKRLHEDMNRLMEDFTRPLVSPAWPLMEMPSPAVDVFERDGSVVVKAEVPGLKKEDIEITATEDSISLKGEFKQEEETKREGFYRHERREGKFFRTVPMPAAIKPDQVKAHFRDGILEVTAPEVEEAKAKERRVPIET